LQAIQVGEKLSEASGTSSERNPPLMLELPAPRATQMTLMQSNEEFKKTNIDLNHVLSRGDDDMDMGSIRYSFRVGQYTNCLGFCEERKETFLHCVAFFSKRDVSNTYL
jgi:hypothetical protein